LQNIRVVAKYYDRITLARLTELLDLPPLTTERTLCKLVTDKIIYARIDRSSGIVTFKPKSNTADILNAWTADIDKMLGLVEKTSHLVSKVSSHLHIVTELMKRSTLCMRLPRERKSRLEVWFRW
jgi:26S proteasome regulatory subunit N5